MIACGGGKNGKGSQANFAVATSHSVRNRPSTTSVPLLTDDSQFGENLQFCADEENRAD
jgi:hypothetical protein